MKNIKPTMSNNTNAILAIIINKVYTNERNLLAPSYCFSELKVPTYLKYIS